MMGVDLQVVSLSIETLLCNETCPARSLSLLEGYIHKLDLRTFSRQMMCNRAFDVDC